MPNNNDACEKCGSSNLEYDEGNYETTCQNCGAIVDAAVIENEVEFIENNKGECSAVGTFVSHKDSGGCSSGLLSIAGLSRNSRELTISRARQKIQALAPTLQLTDQSVSRAVGMYDFCLMKGKTKGRKLAATIGACIYLASRIDTECPLMLIDVADAVQVDIFELGRAYLKIAPELQFTPHNVDPSLFIPRFSHKLSLGKKVNKVTETALRIVQRMRKDWISTGRRPSGICGAALIISARLHGFNRSIDDVIRIVKITKCTIKKRLKEFANTPSSDLTPQEFMNDDLNTEADPPSYSNARKREQELLLSSQTNLSEEVKWLETQIEEILDKQKQSVNPKLIVDHESLGSQIKQFIADSDLEVIQRTLDEEDSIETPAEKTNSANYELLTQWLKDPSVEIDLEGDIDDKEIDSYIMSSADSKRKESLWLDVNKEYLKEQEEKKKREAEEEELREKEGRPKKKRRTYRKRVKDTGECSTVLEAFDKIMDSYPEMSSKINYEALQRMEEDGPVAEPPPKPAPTIHPTPIYDKFSPLFDSINKREANKKKAKRSKVPVSPLKRRRSTQSPQKVRRLSTPARNVSEEEPVSIVEDEEPVSIVEDEEPVSVVEDDQPAVEDDVEEPPEQESIFKNFLEGADESDYSEEECC